MLETTDNTSRALTGDIVIADPVLEADWDLDGYGGEGTIDDLSVQADDINIGHSLFDGLPDEIARLNGTGVPTVRANLGGREVDGVELTATQYWSPYYAGSPLYGKTRDIVPTRAGLKVVTEDGPETVRMFTGLVLDTPTPFAGRAKLEAMSLTRLLLSQAIQPPPMDLVGRPASVVFPSATILMRSPESTQTWPVSWALHRCGVYPSPPRVPGCVVWLPLHGGGGAFNHPREYDNDLELISTHGSPVGVTVRYFDGSVDVSQGLLTFVAGNRKDPFHRRFWVPGPYVSGMDAFFDPTNDRARQVAINVTTATLRTAAPDVTIPDVVGNGRIEMYVRGDEADIDGYDSSYFNLSPGGSGHASLFFGILNRVLAWVGTDRKVRVWFFPTGYSGTRVDLTSTSALPTDGLWHSLGVAWSVASQKMWVNLDGEVDTVTSSNISASATGTTDSMIALSFLPISEFQASAGSDANPDLNATWMRDSGWWTRRAHVHPSRLPIFGTIEPSPREAMEYLLGCAEAELAAITIDADDLLHYRPRAWDATTTGQAVAQTITTERDARVPEISTGGDRIRNAVRLDYELVSRLGINAASLTTPPILEVLTALELPPGVTSYEFALDRPCALTNYTTTSGRTLSPLTAAELADLESGATVIGALFNTMTISTNDGGTTVVESGITAEIVSISPSTFVIEFNNTSEVLLFLANDVSTPSGERVPFLRLAGPTAVGVRGASVIDLDADSIAERGPRALAVRLPQIQTAGAAASIARKLVQLAPRPTLTVPSVEVFGDPRRQPGDLVRLVDSDQTGVDAYCRLQVINNKLTAGQYTQTVSMVESRLVGRWGDGVSRWGRCIWAARENPGIHGEE